MLNIFEQQMVLLKEMGEGNRTVHGLCRFHIER